MSLPIYQTDIREMALLQTVWASQLNPLLKDPLNNGIILHGISLINGVTVINHLLARKLQGWSIVDINGAATVYRSQPKNDKTLTLTSNAAVIVDIFVF